MFAEGKLNFPERGRLEGEGLHEPTGLLGVKVEPVGERHAQAAESAERSPGLPLSTKGKNI